MFPHRDQIDDDILYILTSGMSRICTLRLIANLTYSEKLRDQDLISLLRPAYLGSQKVKQLQDIDRTSVEEHLGVAERIVEICRSPLSIVSTGGIVEPPGQVPNESTIGPIAFLSLLIQVAKRGLFDQIQSWTQLPAGADPSASLRQVKQMSSPDIVKRMLTLASKRVVARNDQGRGRVQSGEDSFYCHAAYLPAVELAAALVVFDEATDGRWSSSVRGARKDLVLNLGNVAEMSIRAKNFESALGFALEACSRWQSAPSSEAIPRSTLEKNERRVAEARRRINADRPSS